MDKKITYGYKVSAISQMNQRLADYYELDRDALRSDCGCIFRVETPFDPQTGFDWGFRMQRCCDKYEGNTGQVCDTGTDISDLESGLDAIIHCFEYGHNWFEGESD